MMLLVQTFMAPKSAPLDFFAEKNSNAIKITINYADDAVKFFRLTFFF